MKWGEYCKGKGEKGKGVKGVHEGHGVKGVSYRISVMEPWSG